MTFFFFKSLATVEIFLTLARLFRRLDMELYETKPQDMEWADMGLPRYKGNLKVAIKDVLK